MTLPYLHHYIKYLKLCECERDMMSVQVTADSLMTSSQGKGHVIVIGPLMTAYHFSLQPREEIASSLPCALPTLCVRRCDPGR